MNYEIVRKCGSGALSEVYEAISNEGETVAVKKLKVFFKDEKKIIDRINKEATVLKELRDEKIVKYRDFFTDESGTPSLVVEFVDGHDLAYFLQRYENNKIPFIGSILVSEILLGLEEVHRLGFIHRDLKPENIMLTKDGKIKITDFGLARNLESHDLTISGTILGSPAYMSPEQCRGDKIDNRSDIFSIGVLLYFFSTLKYPFAGESYPMIVKSITQIDPIQPSQINPRVDERLNKIILKALAKNPKNRYQKVYELRNDLMFFLDEFKASHQKIVFKQFINGDFSEEKKFEQALKEKYICLLENCKQSDQKRAAFYYNQLLKMDPTFNCNIKLDRFNSISKKQIIFLLIFIFVFAFTVVTIFTYYSYRNENNQINNKSRIVNYPIANPTLIEKNIVNKSDLKLNHLLPNKELKKIEEKIEKINVNAPEKNPITGVQFTIPNGTHIYIDDIEVLNTESVYKVNPGKHRLKMIRNNFTPIESTIDVLNEQVTKINVLE